MCDADEDVRKRLRREKAAAWRAEQEGKESVRILEEVADNLKAKSQIKFSKEDMTVGAGVSQSQGGKDEGQTESAGWQSWAKKVGDREEEKSGFGWRHTP